MHTVYLVFVSRLGASKVSGTLMTIGLGALALLAGKALMTAMMSLLLSGIIGLKSLTGGKSSTYEVIAKPVYAGHDEGY
ncbi:Osiris 16, partial [Danaus plexippus plexippus]